MIDDTAKNRGDKRIRFESDVSPKIMSVGEKIAAIIFYRTKSVFDIPGRNFDGAML